MAEAPESAVDKARLDALQLVCMGTIPGAAAALARLNVFQALAQAGDDAALTAQELADSVSMPGKAIKVTYLARLLRMMAAKKILREDVVSVGDDGKVTERRYAFTAMGRFLVDDQTRGSFGPMLLLFQATAYQQVWDHLHETVVDDSVDTFTRTHGANVWEYKKQHPELAELFDSAMAGSSQVYLQATLEVYRGFEHVQVLVDVGGGFGSALRVIAQKYPHIKAINFDQPHVIDACAPIPGVELVGGDMFKSVPSGGDAIFMKYILHDWDDESCVKILKNCYQALPPHGKVIAINNVLPEIINYKGGDHMTIQMDVHMMAYLEPGACERKACQFQSLGLAAGFQKVEVICTVDDLFAVTEFHKAA